MKKGSNCMKMMVVALVMSVVGAVQAAPDYSALSAEVTSGATAAVAVCSVAIVAGFGIFILIWGARKIKGALSSGG